MATFTYQFPHLALETYTRQPASWREDGKLYDEDGREVPTTDLNGVPGPIRTGATGVLAPFKADLQIGTVKFGDTSAVLVQSDDFLTMKARVEELVATAQQAADDANLALTKAVPVRYIGRDPDGRTWVSNTPVEVGGGIPVFEGSRLFFIFS